MGDCRARGEDRCHLTMVSARLDWPTQALGNIGADFEVLEPPEFTAHLLEWGTRFVRASGPTAATPEEPTATGSGSLSALRVRPGSGGGDCAGS
ncbi:hypothetical protein [Lentzea sp. DG1S-22]|uniref:hypothetical protein n=1 Tax=Lentzea sp. DG1S-22 TaxID=3108822 RepID=UPI003FA5B1C9